MKNTDLLRMAAYFFAAVIACYVLGRFGPLADKSPAEQALVPAVFLSTFSTALLFLFGGRARGAKGSLRE